MFYTLQISEISYLEKKPPNFGQPSVFFITNNGITIYPVSQTETTEESSIILPPSHHTSNMDTSQECLWNFPLQSVTAKIRL